MLVWVTFVSFILLLLALDLGAFHRRAHVVSVREGLAWSIVWTLLSFAFAGVVYGAYESHWFGIGMSPPYQPPISIAFSSGAFSVRSRCEA